ncbi:MAG: hypothetical protein HXX16_13510 [Bacteroidales bacterium]|nr:hypothetical protein [Bacteroidales bacterium]
MKTINLMLVIILITSINLLQAQDSCKVLVKNLQGVYSGGCKKGLAHGKGTAKGVDSYEGSFKKGYPNGYGKYIWSSGAIYNGGWEMGVKNGEGKYTFTENGKEIIQDGIWKDDKYVGPKPILPKVIQKTNINSTSFVRTGDGNSIIIKITMNGVSQTVEDFSISASSGTEFSNGSSYGYRGIGFPFTCKITFKSWNQLKSILFDRKLEFEITQPGAWELKIDN